MSAPIALAFNESIERERALACPEYIAGPGFLDAGHWDKASGNALLVAKGSVGRAQPLMCTIMGRVTSNQPALQPHGTYNPKYDLTMEKAKRAKYQFTLGRPSELSEPQFAADFDVAIKRLLALQQQVGTSEKGDHRHFIKIDRVKQQEPTYTLRFNFPIFEQKVDISKVKDDAMMAVVVEKNKLSAAYVVASEYTKAFDDVKETHWALPMPVFVPESTEALGPDDFEARLIGALVEVSFSLQQYRYGSAEYDTFTARVQHVSILENADVAHQVKMSSPIRRKPIRAPQTPSANGSRIAGSGLSIFPSPIPAPDFLQGSSRQQCDPKKRTHAEDEEQSLTSVPSDGEPNIGAGTSESPTKKAKHDDDKGKDKEV